jgi:hypothetical protein
MCGYVACVAERRSFMTLRYTVVDRCKILRSCTCRLISLSQVKISVKRAAFSNSRRNSVCSDKGA